jgi:hypothetical protein
MSEAIFWLITFTGSVVIRACTKEEANMNFLNSRLIPASTSFQIWSNHRSGQNLHGMTRQRSRCE